MIDDHLTDEEVLKLYDKAVDWTPAAGDLGYRCDLSKDPWLYISLVSAYDESKLLSVEYEGGGDPVAGTLKLLDDVVDAHV